MSRVGGASPEPDTSHCRDLEKETIEDDGLENVTSLGPRRAGAFMHVFHDQPAGRAPRVRVYPAKPSAGRAILVSIPLRPHAQPRVICGDASAFEQALLARIVRFVALNRSALMRHWRGEDESSDTLLAKLVTPP